MTTTTNTTTITTANETGQVVLVNTFTVAPEHQEELLQALHTATTSIFTGLPGFVSANLHTSLDGHRVINYAQWADLDSYQAALARADVRAHLASSASIAESYDPTLVQVRSVTTAPVEAA